MTMKLGELLHQSNIRYRFSHDLTQTETDDLLATNITGITDDSRKAGEGSLFFATVHASSFAKAASEAGSVIVTSKSKLKQLTEAVPSYKSRFIVVASPERTMAAMAASLYNHPSKQMTLVAVTGTNGKTTTTHLLYYLWKSNQIKCAMIGTLGIRFFDGEKEEHFETGFTTPRSYELQRVLRELCNRGINYVAMEASSEALSLGRLGALTFRSILFTGLGRDHLDHHKTMQGYMRAKRHLFFLAARSDHQVSCFVWAKGDALLSLQRFERRIVKPQFSFEWIHDHDIESKELFELPVPTQFNRINAVLAKRAFETVTRAQKPLKISFTGFNGVAGRMEKISLSPYVDSFVDYAHSPDSLERVLIEVRSLGYDHIITVFGCGGDRDPGKRPLMGRIAFDRSDLCIVTDDNPRTEDAAKIRKQIMQPLTLPLSSVQNSSQAADAPRIIEIGDRRLAIQKAVQEAISQSLQRAGQNPDQEDKKSRIAVIVAGKGHETYQIIGRQKSHFSDREEIEAAITLILSE
mgnify:CR=1 FL=1